MSVAWKGQFEGKKGCPTIGLETVADHNLWIWHSAFGFAGTLNNINIGDRSPLYESILDGRHEQLDFTFKIDEQHFDYLYYLVDEYIPPYPSFCQQSMIQQQL